MSHAKQWEQEEEEEGERRKRFLRMVVIRLNGGTDRVDATDASTQVDAHPRADGNRSSFGNECVRDQTI